MKYSPLLFVLAPLAAADFGPLESITSTPFRVHAELIDLDGDGLRDLVVATADGLLRLDGLPGTQFSAPFSVDATPCTHVEVIDLDQDGDLDVVKGGLDNPTETENGFYITDGAGLLRIGHDQFLTGRRDRLRPVDPGSEDPAWHELVVRFRDG